MSYLVSSVTHGKNPFLGGFPALMANTLIECCTLKIELFVFPLSFLSRNNWSISVVWFVDLQHDICNRMARADA